MSVLGFDVEWFDPIAGLLQTMYLKFFLDDNTLEILTDKGAFLKRIYYPDVKVNDLFIGNSITVYNRLLIIKKCANSATQKFMDQREVRYLCIIKSNDLKAVGSLLIAARSSFLKIGKVVTLASSFDTAISKASVGDVALELVGVMNTDQKKFETLLDSPKLSSVKAVQVSAAEINDFFSHSRKALFTGESCTLCLVKPHIVMAEQTGEVINAITEAGFHVKSLFAIHLTLGMAEELLEVYRGVLQNYTAVVQHMCVTPVFAIMITGSPTIVNDFREFCGPQDPELARLLRPESLRARFGKENVVYNGVHCTDLPEDGEMECRYLFETLSSL